MRTVTLPAINKTVSLDAYIKAVKTARDNPDVIFKTGLTTWWETSGAEIMNQFRHGMHDRINQGISYSQRGVTVGAIKKPERERPNRPYVSISGAMASGNGL